MVANLAIRSVHNNDIVPHLPPMLLDFWHVETEVWIPEWQGTYYVICTAGQGEDPSCSDSLTFPLGIAAHNWYFGQLMSCG